MNNCNIIITTTCKTLFSFSQSVPTQSEMNYESSGLIDLDHIEGKLLNHLFI